MIKTLTNQDLDLLLQAILNSKEIYYDWSKDYFLDLYNTGCRSQEPLLISRWSFTHNNIILSTLKTEAIRIFKPTLISNTLLASIADETDPYNGLTYDQLTLEFRKVCPIHPIYSGKRVADTYLFRYNRARLLFRETNSVTQVMDFFGWYSEKICMKYILTPLTYESNMFSVR